MKPDPSPRRTLPPRCEAPAPGSVSPWTAVMWTTAAFTRDTTSANEGAPPAATRPPRGRESVPPPPASTPRSPATAATRVNEKASTTRCIVSNGSISGSGSGQERAQAGLVQDRDAQLPGLLVLRAGVLAHHDIRGLLRDRRRHAPSLRLDGRPGLVA